MIWFGGATSAVGIASDERDAKTAAHVVVLIFSALTAISALCVLRAIIPE